MEQSVVLQLLLGPAKVHILIDNQMERREKTELGRIQTHNLLITRRALYHCAANFQSGPFDLNWCLISFRRESKRIADLEKEEMLVAKPAPKKN